MKLIKYLIEFFFVIFLFFIFKIIGVKNSSNFGCFLFRKIGPLFRKKDKIINNIRIGFPNISGGEIDIIVKNMWCNYGRTFSEYMHLNYFKQNKFQNIKIKNIEKFNEIKNLNRPILFYSGHFANFELLAMILEKNNFNVCALYRPLNNFFLNPIMKYLRVKYLCKDQIPKSIPGKGKLGTRILLNRIKLKKNIALMVDQKVNEGIKVDLFKKKAHTIKIPAQLAIKHNYILVPLKIERKNSIDFVIEIREPVTASANDNELSITKKVNLELEKMIIENPSQWIWTHDRWRI